MMEIVTFRQGQDVMEEMIAEETLMREIVKDITCKKTSSSFLIFLQIVNQNTLNHASLGLSCY